MKKKLLLFVMMLVVSMLFVPDVFAAGEAMIGEDSYATLEEAYANAVDNDIIVLQSDVTLENSLVVTKDISIDLNTFSIEKDSDVIHVDGGSLLLIGEGTIRETNPDNAGIKLYGAPTADVADYSYVSIGKDVTVEAWAPLMITKRNNTAYGVSADVYGTLIGKKDRASRDSGGLYVNGSIQHKTNFPVIQVHDNATITSEGVGMYLAGYAEVTVGAVNITGTGAGIAIKAGTLNLNNTNIKATGSYADPSGNDNGVNTIGAAIQVESNASTASSSYAGDIKININGGTYESVNNSAIVEYLVANETKTSVTSMSIKAGTFKGKAGSPVITASDEFKTANTKFITGGTYSSSVEEYLAEGLKEGLAENNYKVEAKVDLREENTTPVEGTTNPDTADINILVLLALIAFGSVGLGFTLKKRNFN